MNRFSRVMARFWPLFLVVAVQSALLSGPRSAKSAVVPEKPFVPIKDPIGVFTTPGNGGFVTRLACGSTELWRFDSTGAKSLFATLTFSPTGEGCREDYVVVAPGPRNYLANGVPSQNEAGFVANEIYVAQGSKIAKIPLDPNTLNYLPPVLWTTLAPCGRITGLTFDGHGAFGSKLLVFCSTRQVWSVGVVEGSASPTLLTTMQTCSGEFCTPIPGPFETPVVARTGPFAGTLLVAADNAGGDGSAGEVFKVTPSGTVTPVANIGSAEGVTIVESTRCSFGRTHTLPNGDTPRGPTYFAAIFGVGGDTIDYLPQSALTGFEGSALVPTENGENNVGIARIQSPSTVSTFRDFFAQHQGAHQVDCLVPKLVKITRKKGPGPDEVTVQYPSDSEFFAGDMIASSVRFGPNGNENNPPKRCKLAKRGENDEDRDKDKDKGEGKDKEKGQLNDEDEAASKGITTCVFTNNLGSTPIEKGKSKFIYKPPFSVGDPDGDGDG
jgi:hypothetical protein